MVANAPAQVNPQSGEIAKAAPLFTDEQLRSVTDLESLRAIIGDKPTLNATDLGSGFAILEDKNRLIKRNCVFLGWSFHEGDHGTFVSILIVELNNDGSLAGKWIVNDGSTGICQQLATVTRDTGSFGPMAVPNGLRRSDYKYTDDDGKEKPASTYYVDNAPESV